MLQYDRIGISEGIDIIKIDASKECMLFHYWYLKCIGIEFEPHICNGCHYLSMMVYDLKEFHDCKYKWCRFFFFPLNGKKNKAISKQFSIR